MPVLSLIRRILGPGVDSVAATVPPKETDPIAATIDKHVKVIDRNSKSISEIEHGLYQQIGELQVKRTETNRLYQHLLADIDREIKRLEIVASRKVELRRRLIKSSEAALTPLQSDPELRPVERPTVPIMRHMDIRS